MIRHPLRDIAAAAAVALCVAGARAGEDCCAAGELPGCGDPACVAAVCPIDPWCCDVAWDGLCAEQATTLCPWLCGAAGCGDPGAGDCREANGTPFCDCAACCAVVCAADSFCCDVLWDGLCADQASAACVPTLRLIGEVESGPGGPVLVVSVQLENEFCTPAAGFQAFLAFDDDRLDYLGGDYDPTPFGLPILFPIPVAGNEINLASGLDPSQPQAPFVGTAVLAQLLFEVEPGECEDGASSCCQPQPSPGCDDAACQSTVCAIDPFCCASQWDAICVGEAGDLCGGLCTRGGGASAVSFRPFALPTRIADIDGNEIPGLVLVDAGPVAADGTPPTWTALPEDLVVPADAGTCSALVAVAPPTATDACGSVTVEGRRSDDESLAAPDPVGTTIVTWIATDEAGNAIEAIQSITVEAVSELVLTVAFAGPSATGPYTRCIELTLYDCPESAPLAVELSFVGGVGTATILVPCREGGYECAVGRDPLHTLSRTVSVGLSGAKYLVSFTGGNALLRGDLDGNGTVNATDLALLQSQFGMNVGADTPCGTLGPHADLNGDGKVNANDRKILRANLREDSEPGCGCGTGPLPGS